MPGSATRLPSAAGRRTGYGAAIVVNAALLLAANVWPGWEVLPFLTADTTRVLGLVNLALVAGIVVNAVYLVNDRPAVRALGDLLTTAVGLAAVIRLLQVFPFDFPGTGFDWAVLARVLLVLGVVGASVAVVVAAVSLVRALAGRSPRG
ncbi:MAG TPA: hypothetical protein VD813_12980 [Pseudonocardia sp.]|nr:hypothetical protein [Pseudonocardia sp.]